MSMEDQPQAGAAAGAAPNDVVETLLKAAGRRLAPPADDYQRVLAAANAALDAKLAGRRRRTWQYSAAAAVAVAAIAALWVLAPGPESVRVGTVERLVGEVRVRGAEDDDWRTPASPLLLDSGSIVRTGVGAGAGIRLASGTSLRLAAGTEVRLAAASRLELRSGTIYLDSGMEALPGRAVEVVTKRATARDIGTQFEVRLVGDDWRLRVREGRVAVAYSGGETAGSAGDQLRIDSDGRVERSRIALTGPGWSWAESLAESPEVDDQPLSRVLAWVSRETGRAIRFESAELERRAAGTIVHGSIDGLDPLAALDVVLATSDLRYTIMTDEAILISSR